MMKKIIAVIVIIIIAGVALSYQAKKPIIPVLSTSSSGTTTGGMPFGPFNFEHTPNTTSFTGGQTWLSPKDALTTLNSARSRKAHLQVHLNGNHQDFVNSDGSFSLVLWKQRLDLFLTKLGRGDKQAGINFIQGYVADGTIIGHFMIDEPQDTNGNWGGHAFSLADLEAAAAYSKSYWPTLATGIGSNPEYLASCTNNCYPDLDYTSTPYSGKKGDITSWIAGMVAAAKQLGLRIAFSINVINGGTGGGHVAASDLKNWGSLMIAEPYNSMLTIYQYDPSYFGQTDVAASVTSLTAQAAARADVHSLLK